MLLSVTDYCTVETNILNITVITEKNPFVFGSYGSMFISTTGRLWLLLALPTCNTCTFQISI
jgi:hypothetical protein